MLLDSGILLIFIVIYLPFGISFLLKKSTKITELRIKWISWQGNFYGKEYEDLEDFLVYRDAEKRAERLSLGLKILKMALFISLFLWLEYFLSAFETHPLIFISTLFLTVVLEVIGFLFATTCWWDQNVIKLKKAYDKSIL